MISSLDVDVLKRLAAGERLVAYHDVKNWQALLRQGFITIGFGPVGEPDRERLWCTITVAGHVALDETMPQVGSKGSRSQRRHQKVT